MNSEFKFALQRGLLTANRLRDLRDNFTFIGQFSYKGHVYAFIVNGAGQGTYRCQEGMNYANCDFKCTVSYELACPVLSLIDSEDDNLPYVD